MKKSPSLNIIRGKSLTILLTVAITIVLSVLLIMVSRDNNILYSAPLMNESNPDKLIYVSDDNQLISYDPQNRIEEIILDNVRSFEYSPDGRIAFTRQIDKSTDLYVYDPSTPDIAPIQIIQNLERGIDIWSIAYPFEWSPDGRYLMFISYSETGEGKLINIWDGETITNIMPDDEVITNQYQRFIWTPDGHYLAFTSRLVTGEGDALNVWDGEKTINIMPDDGQLRAKSIAMDWSSDGQLAFTLTHGGANGIPSGIYVWDSEATINILPDESPINSGKDTYGLLDWSPDGQYFAFGSLLVSGKGNSLYVWDRETTINILPSDALGIAQYFEGYWSFDGRLAFIISYENDSSNTELNIPSEIYIWDGNTTSNLSQTPEIQDSDVKWSADGQLFFTSFQEDEIDLWVWDGVSFKDGSPDASKLTDVTSSLKPTFAKWRSDGSLAIIAHTYPVTENIKQKLIIWDMESKTIVKEIPISSEYYRSWMSDDGQVIFSSRLASGAPSVYLDVQDIQRQVTFTTHSGDFSWSGDGYLAFCKPSWTLSIWDGYETWDVTPISYKPMQWQNERRTFSCNSG